MRERFDGLAPEDRAVVIWAARRDQEEIASKWWYGYADSITRTPPMSQENLRARQEELATSGDIADLHRQYAEAQRQEKLRLARINGLTL